MIKEYIINFIIILIISFISAFFIKKIIRIKTVGGKIATAAVSVVGAILGSYLFPLIKINVIKIDMPSAFLGSIIMLLILHLVSPISFKN